MWLTWGGGVTVEMMTPIEVRVFLRRRRVSGLKKLARKRQKP